MRRCWLLACGLLVAALPASAEEFRFLQPAAGETIHPGEVVAIQWTGAPQGSREMELLLSLDGGRSFNVRLTHELNGKANAYLWTVPNLPAQSIRLALRAESWGAERMVGQSSEVHVAPLHERTGSSFSLQVARGEIWLVDSCATAVEPAWEHPLDLGARPVPSELVSATGELAALELRPDTGGETAASRALDPTVRSEPLPQVLGTARSLRRIAPLPLRI